ncbi:MAG TPA: hypothetical protein VN921_06030 [Chthoniobacterales bacterium]|nr:hypothetical protein [Chthoniobacterales bacterium]
MRSALACLALLVCAACNTLENWRDLYSPDSYFVRERPVTTTVRHTTTTTTAKTAPVEFRPHADQD